MDDCILTIHLRHTEIHQDEVGSPSERLFDGCGPVVGLDHFISQAPDDERLELSAIFIVFDYKYFFGGVHSI